MIELTEEGADGRGGMDVVEAVRGRDVVGSNVEDEEDAIGAAAACRAVIGVDAASTSGEDAMFVAFEAAVESDAVGSGAVAAAVVGVDVAASGAAVNGFVQAPGRTMTWIVFCNFKIGVCCESMDVSETAAHLRHCNVVHVCTALGAIRCHCPRRSEAKQHLHFLSDDDGEIDQAVPPTSTRVSQQQRSVVVPQTGQM